MFRGGPLEDDWAMGALYSSGDKSTEMFRTEGLLRGVVLLGEAHWRCDLEGLNSLLGFSLHFMLFSDCHEISFPPPRPSHGAVFTLEPFYHALKLSKL